LRIGLDQADGVLGLDSRQSKADGERAFAAAALLSGQNDRMHWWSFELFCGI
jgi:hypothetical protein